MLLTKESTRPLDLCKSEELKYQLSETRYHLQNIRMALQEALYHLKKSAYHASLIKESNKNFKF